jgi:hypothetical protein
MRTVNKGVRIPKGAPPQSAKMQLYLQIGQSNMAGRGKVGEEDKTPHPRVLMLNKKEQWVPAVDPIHFDKSIAGVGPGLTFGKVLADADASVTIGLIPCAAGGSPISVWQPGSYFKGTNSKPYDEMLRRVKIALESGELKGILWHQGESDSNDKNAALYAERLADLIARLRKDLGAADVPFVVGGLSDPLVAKNEQAKIVDQALRDLSKQVPNTAYASAAGLKLMADNVHFDAEAARELGRRFARAMQKWSSKK